MAGLLLDGTAFGRTMNIGKAELVVPDVKSTSVEQEERRLQVGIDVFKDDVVQTGGIGAVILQFTDKTTLKIFPNSTVKLDNYVYDADKTVLQIGLSLLSGAMRIASGGPHTADKYQLRTPLATIGIRGTVVHIVSEKDRTVVEALHGTFNACATTSSACRTVLATDDMNALQLWSDGRLEKARARRDLGVRSAHGSSTLSAAGGSATTVISTGSDPYDLIGQSYSLNIGGYVSGGNNISVGGFTRANPGYSPIGNGGNALYYSVSNSTASPNGIGGQAFGNGAGEFGLAQGTGSLEALFSSAPGAGSGAGSGSGSAPTLEANANLLEALLAAIPSGGGGGVSSGSGGGSGGAPSPAVNTGVGLLLAGATFAFLRRKGRGRHARVAA
ncbi:FecR domain-containing protein [Methylobacterium sp. A49B]